MLEESKQPKTDIAGFNSYERFWQKDILSKNDLTSDDEDALPNIPVVKEEIFFATLSAAMSAKVGTE